MSVVTGLIQSVHQNVLDDKIEEAKIVWEGR